MQGNTVSLGDKIADVLGIIGISPERMERWLGRPCGCEERREKLNALGRWAGRILGGRVGDAERYLETIMEE